MVNNRKCLACQTGFSFCPDCSKSDKLSPSWRAQFCSETCKTIWTTLTKYNMSHLTKPEAKEIISGLDLKPIESYAECVRRDYAQIMAEEKKPRKNRRPEPIIEVETMTIERSEIEAPQPTIYEVVNEKTENE